MRVSFRTKLTLGFDLVLILFSLLIINFFYSKAHYVQRDNLRSRLIGIASTAALMIDGDKHEVLLAPADASRPEFESIRSVLTRIRESNPGIKFIYTMRRGKTPGMTEFVIDEAQESDDNGNGIIDPKEVTAEIGQLYDASAYPEMLASFQGPRADQSLQDDQWGTWLSGYAPIFNSRHQAVGILGIDMAADDVKREEKVLEITALFILTIAVIGSVVVGLLLARHFTDPIRGLLKGIRRIGEGKLDTRLDLKRQDEIGDLGRAFNAMAENLAVSRKKLDEYNRLLEEKVDERTRELKSTQEALILKEKMTAVGSLAGGVAHEFNNLFASIRGYAELALSKEDAAAKNEALRIAIKMADRAKKITAALLSFCGPRSPKREKIDIRETLEFALSLLKRDLNTYNIKVIREYQEVPAVWGDPQQIQHVLVNILVNAKDAMMGNGGLLNAAIGMEGDRVFVRIADTGSGIDPEVRRRIFEPFRGTKGVMSGGSARYSGLGLFVALGIVKAHRGEIRVESEPGLGAAFTVLLPTSSPDPLEQELPPESARRPEPVVEAGSRRLLIVDDEEAIAKLLKEFLESRGFVVDVAANGWEAVERADGAAYDVILMDIAMPGMDGESAIKMILSRRADSRFIVISGYSPPELAPELRTCVRGMVQKPFSLSQVAAAVFRALGPG
jgi:signal transduction histidine kinase